MVLRASLDRLAFCIAVTCIGRALVLRDRLVGWVGRDIPHAAKRVQLRSGRNVLDAVFLQATGEEQGAVLICHGIGEVVEHWCKAQTLLAEHGITSLVFNYSGCGRSSGVMSAKQCERDAVVAFKWLKRRVGSADITLLGFSLGSGVATALLGRLPLRSMVLCEAYTSFREAAVAMGWPRWFSRMVPDLWRNCDALEGHEDVEVLILHGAADRLFPVGMAKRLHACCGLRGQLVVVPGMAHDTLHSKALEEHWRPIISALTSA